MCFLEIVLLVLQLQVELLHFVTVTSAREVNRSSYCSDRSAIDGEVEDEFRERKDAALCCNELVGVCVACCALLEKQS